MGVLGASVTVTVKGFGSKSGTIDQYDHDKQSARPYHVTFRDGQGGWFDASQVSFDTRNDADVLIKAAERMFDDAIRMPSPPPHEQDEWLDEED